MILEFRHAKSIIAQLGDSYRVSNNGELPLTELLLFLGVPLAASITLVSLKIFPESVSSDLLAALAIFVGFLINMLIPFFSIVEKTDAGSKRLPEEDRAETLLRLRQYRILYIQVSFATLISLGTIALLLLLKMTGGGYESWSPGFWTFHITLGELIHRALFLLIYWGVGLIFFSILQVVVSSNALLYPYLKKHTS
jgi:hypothetical protein